MLTRRLSPAALVLGFLILSCGSSWAGPVNINTADAAALANELAGVGPKLAQAIVEYRGKHGPFKSADELSLVKGVGPAIIKKNRELIRTDAKVAAKPVSKAAPEGGRTLPAQR